MGTLAGATKDHLDARTLMLDGYRHEAMPYRGHDEFVSSCVALARGGLDRDERMIFLAAAGKLDDVRDHLGADATDITFVPTDEHGRNPARITTLLDTFQAGGNGRRNLGVNELVVAGRPRPALLEAQFAETVLNAAALQHWPLSLVCTYDCLGLDEDTITEMRRSHPVVRGEQDNSAYDPNLAGTLFTAELDPRPAEAKEIEVGAGGLAGARGDVRAFAAAAGLPPDRVEDVVLAANEVMANSLRHGGGRCRVAMWRENGAVVCEVRDRGVITDPLVGRLAPPPTASAGRGLWLANHLCDLVQIRSSQAGTVVRLYVEL